MNPFTVAVSCCVVPSARVTDDGLIVTVFWIVIVAVALWLGSATLVAVTVTVPPAGAGDGAR